MQPATILRAPLPMLRTRLPPASVALGLRPFALTSAPTAFSRVSHLQAQRRWQTQDNRGGKSKLIFRFGLKDLPVEIYPMLFVVAVACVGAAFAVGRHFYLDGLRLGPSGGRAKSGQETKYE